jgi:hypothetical protein
MSNRMTERMSVLGDRARNRITASRLDKVDRENDRLKHEVRMLREDLREERGSLERALDALTRDEHVTVHTKAPKRRGRLLRTIVIGGRVPARSPCRPGALRPDRREGAGSVRFGARPRRR